MPSIGAHYDVALQASRTHPTGGLRGAAACAASSYRWRVAAVDMHPHTVIIIVEWHAEREHEFQFTLRLRRLRGHEAIFRYIYTVNSVSKFRFT